VPPIQKSSRTAKCPNPSSHNNSKGSEETDLNKAGRNASSDHPYLCRLNHRSPTSQTQTRMTNPLQRLGSRHSSMTLGSWKKNAYAVGFPYIMQSAARNIHAPTSPNTLFLLELENKSNASATSIVNIQLTILPVPVHSSVGEDGRTRAWIAVIGYESIAGTIRGNLFPLDFTKAEGCPRAPETSHVEPIFAWNGKIGFTAHCPRSPDTRLSQGIPTNTSTHRLLL
jgi:hypothetical protein